jgi:polyphenol oxidase
VTQVVAAWPLVEGLYRSPLLGALGLVAGFTSASLGSMAGSVHPQERQEQSRRSLAAGLGFDRVVRLRQVHGAGVVRVPFGAAEAARGTEPEGDALWTDRRGILLGVAAADCVPVLVAEPGGRVGAAHAGWAGTTRGVVAALVREMVAAGAAPERLVAAIGPSIGPCCYTIDEERAAAVRRSLGERFLSPSPAPGGGVGLDLWQANAAQLVDAGVRTVDLAGLCTRCGGADTWSYRARHERGPQGTGMAVIGWPP